MCWFCFIKDTLVHQKQDVDYVFSELFLWILTRILFLQIQPNQPLDELSIACILCDLLHAIEYLHSEGKIHRDIKGSLFSFIAKY